MRILNAAVGAVLLILVASPAFAGDRRGGGHPGGGGCAGSCGGGGHQPPPYTPPPSHGGSYNSNVNVNVNANANSNANAFAGASAGSYFNARTYDVGGIRGGGYGGGTIYVGGGYGGDGGGYYGGGAIYTEEVYEGRTCASAPFGYVVNGFGRTGRRAPACVATSVCRDGDDRGGRYGYSEGRGCDGGGRRESCGSYEETRSCEHHGPYGGRAVYREESSYSSGHDCGCDRGDRPDAPYPPPHLPEPPRNEPPRYEPPAPPARPYQPPRQHYSQEPGERG
jgi:hypothetical protein